MRVLASAAGLAVAGGLVFLSAVGLLPGPLSLLLAAAGWVLLPSAPTLARRLATNGAIGLGAIPLLWWAPWPVVGGAGHGSLVVALLMGAVALLALWSAKTRQSLVPRMRLPDLLIGIAAAAVGWVFLPYFRSTAGAPALDMLVRASGSDNVAHFDMFEMIRRTHVAGPLWGEGSDGSSFAYLTYPQHFHGLVVFGADLWHGASVGTSDVEAGLFGIGTAIAIGAVVITLVAAIVSIPQFARRFWLAAAATATVLSVLVLGVGAEGLAYGFPGYLTGVAGTALALVLAIGRRRASSTLDLAAVAGAVVLVAHCWVLLAPVAGVAAVFMVIGLPWERYRENWRRVLGPAAVALAGGAATAFGGVLAVRATSSVMSPEQALATPGAIPRSDVPLIVAIGLATAAVAIVLLTRALSRGRVIDSPALPILASVIVAAVVGAGLIALQLRQINALDYFQFKYLNAQMMVFAVVLAVAVGLLMAAPERAASSRRDQVLGGLAGVGVCSAIVLFSGLPVGPSSAFAEWRLPVLNFRTDLQQAAATPSQSIKELGLASDAMAASACASTFYLAEPTEDLEAYRANQWAISLSSRWTEGASGVTSLIFDNLDSDADGDLSDHVTELLSDDRERCMVISVDTLELLDPDIVSRLSDRITAF